MLLPNIVSIGLLLGTLLQNYKGWTSCWDTSYMWL